jgi:flagellar hook-associated protein 2
VADLGLAGLASGVDTTAIVEQLMNLERQSKARLQQRQGGITAQQTTLRDLKTKLDALKAAAADLRASTTWSQGQTVESSDAGRVAVASMGGAPIGGYSVAVTQLASSAQQTFGWTESAAASTLALDDGPAGNAAVTIDIAAGAKIADVAAAINGRGDLPVYAAVVGGDKLVLSSRATGAAAQFSATGAQLSPTTAQLAGRNARFSVDGGPEQESATNVVEDAIPGLRLTFKGTTPDPAAIVVGAPGIDREKVKGEIKAFVDAYNAVVTATRAKVGEKSVQNPTTQTDYNKGQFFGDSSLNSMLSKLRSTMGLDYTATIGATAAYDELRDIGISTGKPGATTADAKAGLLTIDDAQLSAALEADAEGVRRLLGGAGPTAFAQDVEKLATDLGKRLDGRVAAGDTESRRLSDEMLRADTRLAAKEQRLKAQFAAMEAALNASQTQMSWLQGQLAGLPTWQ